MGADSKDYVKESTASTDTKVKTKTVKKRKGVLSRLWGVIFRLHGDDFEKRLQYISKEEATILSRITRRSNSWQRMARHLILFSLLLEAMALGYAIMTTRALDLGWKMRALRVFPVFLLPALSYVTYFTLRSFTRMFDQKDKKTLEKLRAERQAKLDELKERTNYYTTQQLIQRYDTDPAAKAAAATVLAAKLGADSGLKLYMEDDSKQNVSTGKSNDMQVERTNGLRNMKRSRTTNTSTKNAITHQMVVEHHAQTGPMNNGGWIARFAAFLVGEDPAQSYALICGNCHMHNALRIFRSGTERRVSICYLLLPTLPCLEPTKALWFDHTVDLTYRGILSRGGRCCTKCRWLNRGYGCNFWKLNLCFLDE